MSESGDGFSERMVLMLTMRQREWRDEEVLRRKRAGEISPVEAAHGGNRNLNRGTLIREAIESHFPVGS